MDSGSTSRPRSRWASGLPAVTPDQIIDAALGLTSQYGLEEWTVRQLANAVQAYPAVVYHHVGDREAVVNAVLERVVMMLPVPPAELPWRDWFRVLLGELRRVLRRYPGTARRLAMHGPAVAGAATLIDRGVRALQDAGFGRESVLAYNVLLSVACQFIAIEDDRERNSAARKQMAEVHGQFRDSTEQPGLAAMASFVHEMAEHPDRVEGFYASFYDYAIQRSLDGVNRRLTELTGRS